MQAGRDKAVPGQMVIEVFQDPAGHLSPGLFPAAGMPGFRFCIPYKDWRYRKSIFSGRYAGTRIPRKSGGNPLPVENERQIRVNRYRPLYFRTSIPLLPARSGGSKNDKVAVRGNAGAWKTLI